MNKWIVLCAPLLSVSFIRGFVYSQEYWQPMGPDGGGIYVVETHPEDSTLVFCASRQEKSFFLSTDKGLTWEARRNGLSGFSIWCIEPHPVHPEIIYLGGSNNIYKTTDMGLNWYPSSQGIQGIQQIIYSIAADAANDSLVYAGTFWGFYKSTNGGEYWEQTSLGHWTWDIEIDHFNPSTVYASTENGLYISRDYGESWELRTSGLDVTTMTAVEQSPSDSLRLYIAGGSLTYPGKIYKTTDRGVSWTDITDSLGVELIQDLAVSSRDPDVLYACVYRHGIYKTTDGGSSWTRSSEGLQYLEMTRMSIMEKEPEIVFTSDQYRGGVYRSSNGGATWQESNSGIRLFDIKDIEFIGEEYEILLCTTEDGLKKYYSMEERWEDIEVPCEEMELYSWLVVYDVAVHPENDLILFIAADCGVLKSTDGGQNWVNLYPYPTGFEYDPLQIIIHLMNPDQIAVLAKEEYYPAFLKSTDGGNEWETNIFESGGVPEELVGDPTSLSIYYMVLGGWDSYYKTTDGGSSWFVQTLVSGVNWINSMVLDPNNPSHLYAAVDGEDNGIYFTDNGGESWELIWEVDDPYKLALDPVNSSTVYCWAERGDNKVYKSTNGGYDWEDISYNLNELTFDDWALSMKVHPIERNKLYVGTGHAGILLLEQPLGIIEHDPNPSSSQIKELNVLQNYPNPFNPMTMIEVAIPEEKEEKVSLRIYDLRGRLVRALVEESLPAGRYHLVWDGRSDRGEPVPSGVYLYTLRQGSRALTRKMTILR